jgi:hypothetical protein
MRKKSNVIFQGLYALFILIALYFLHNYANEQYQWVQTEIVFSVYVVLFLLTLLFFILFGIAKKNMPDHLGFLYLFWVMIKFVVLFILFFSEVNNNIETKRAEVFTLIFPYLVSVFLSAYPLSIELNKSEFN